MTASGLKGGKVALKRHQGVLICTCGSCLEYVCLLFYRIRLMHFRLTMMIMLTSLALRKMHMEPSSPPLDGPPLCGAKGNL